MRAEKKPKPLQMSSLGEFFLPLVDTALNSLNDRFSKMEDVYGLFGFLFSKENMRESNQTGKLTEN